MLARTLRTRLLRPRSKAFTLNKISKVYFSEPASSEAPQKTSLYNFHKDQMKAKMTEFGGYIMPVQYTGIIDEHHHCRNSAAIFDVSHMGQVRIHGKDRFDFIESVCVGDIKELNKGSATLSVMTNENGGIIDDTIITSLPDFLHIVFNAGCKHKDLAHIRRVKEERFKDKDVTIEYFEDKSLVALQGPKAAFTLQKLVAANLTNLGFMEAVFMEIPQINETVLVSRCGYTGEDGFEISVSDANASKLCETLLGIKENGTPVVKCAGLGARDSLRLEAGLCLYGHDINDVTTPIEAGLKWLIGKRRKVEGGFPGFDKIQKQMNSNSEVKTRRIGFVLETTKAPAREGTKIITNDDSKASIGTVTSGCPSPTLSKPVGMAYVRSKYSKIGTEIKVVIRNTEYVAKVSKMPFVPTKYYKKEDIL